MGLAEKVLEGLGIHKDDLDALMERTVQFFNEWQVLFHGNGRAPGIGERLMLMEKKLDLLADYLSSQIKTPPKEEPASVETPKQN